MNFLAKENVDRWHQLAWWLCVITLPWIDMANNVCLILLVAIWIAGRNFKIKWAKLTAAKWTWPFLVYYLLLVVGMIYTNDVENGLFTLDKKITFFILPIIAATEGCLNEKFVRFLKWSFVYSCVGVILVCLGAAAYSFFHDSTIANFDFSTNENFKIIHPDASPAWMHFSYIQLGYWAGFHPAYLSMYLVFCLVILYTETDAGRSELHIHFLLGFLIVSFIALLSSRMAILSFAGSAIYLTIVKIRKKEAKGILSIVSLSFFLMIFLWLNPVARFRVIEEPMITTYHANQTVTNWNSVSYRLLEWEGSWSVIKTHWFGGVGTGGGKLAMKNFYAHYNNSTVGLDYNAHDQYLQTWMESGFLGLIAFLFCLWIGLFRFQQDSSYVCFILIFSLMCLTESIGERQKGIVFFALFQVLFLGFEKRNE